MGFWIARADATGAKIAASEMLLPMSPTRVDYPVEALGTLLETADGNVVQQQMNKDGRRRAWVWENYRDTVVGWEDLWNQLLNLRSRHLIEGGAATPYVYLKENESRRLRRRSSVAGTATSGGATTLTDTGLTMTTNEFQNGWISIVDGTGVGQTRKIISNTTTAFTVAAWAVNPNNTSKYEAQVMINDWFRCRVLDVSRKTQDRGGPTQFVESSLVFVIDDPTYNDIG